MISVRMSDSNQGDFTINLPKYYEAFGISNDGKEGVDPPIVFTINNIDITVMPGESWESGFKSFNTVVITGASPYRWYVGF